MPRVFYSPMKIYPERGSFTPPRQPSSSAVLFQASPVVQARGGSNFTKSSCKQNVPLASQKARLGAPMPRLQAGAVSR